MLALRNQYPVFVTDEATVLDTPDARLAAFTLAGEDQTLLVAHHFSHGEALFMPMEGTLLASFDTGDVRSSESAGGAWIELRSTAVWALR